MISHQRGLLALYSATVILAINGVLSKSIPLDAITITFARCGIACIALCMILQLQRSQNLLSLKARKSYGFVLLVGALMACHWSSFFHAMQISTVAIGILAHYSFPVITVIIEPLLDKQKPQKNDLLAGMAVLMGVGLMVPSWDLNSQAFLGVAFGLLSGATWAVRNIVQRRWLSQESSQSIMIYQLLVILLFTAAFIDYPSLLLASNNTWLMLLLLGVVSTALGHTLFSISLRVMQAKSASLISCLQPPIAVGLSWLILAEQPTVQTLIGGSMILGIALYEAIKIKA
ncbi:DMT family transporter [Marinagarivorans algicola]|uniref:DMT family transporter n=1 Tax=Marinagarivorans algicola TaxID=1513270 RepID=UPI0006B4CBC6|nr:DMT family transporter [Marinagarivorans algicola]